MTVRQLLPEGLAEMAPGPRLGAVLASLDLRALAGPDLVEVLRARARQLAHEQAQLLAVMAEIGWCDPHAGPDEVARLAQLPGENEPLVSAADEIRAAPAWTRNAAYRDYHFAQSLLGRLPTVFTTLDVGAIRRSKAWLFTELCVGLTEEQAQMVAERLLPQAGRLTTGELAERIKKLAIALDPEWAAHRHAAAVRDRDVIGYLHEDSTATVTGRRLPAEQAAAAYARIKDLAKAAKRAGYPGWDRGTAPPVHPARRTGRTPRDMRTMGCGDRRYCHPAPQLRHRRLGWCGRGWRAGPVRPVRWDGAAPPHPDPGPDLCLPGVSLLSPHADLSTSTTRPEPQRTRSCWSPPARPVCWVSCASSGRRRWSARTVRSWLAPGPKPVPGLLGAPRHLTLYHRPATLPSKIGLSPQVDGTTGPDAS